MLPETHTPGHRILTPAVPLFSHWSNTYGTSCAQRQNLARIQARANCFVRAQAEPRFLIEADMFDP